TLPITSLNTIVAMPGELWALRYPDARPLHILPRPAALELHGRSSTSSYHVPQLASAPSVVIASEELDGESGWRMLAPRELVHVREDLTIDSTVVISDPPAQKL